MITKVYRSKGLEIIMFAKSRCPYTGQEAEYKAINPKIRRYVSFGCERLVIYENNKAVAGLQIMIREMGYAIVANVYTMPRKRRRGYARALWTEAKIHHPIIFHSRNLSEDGKIFAEHCK